MVGSGGKWEEGAAADRWHAEEAVGGQAAVAASAPSLPYSPFLYLIQRCGAFLPMSKGGRNTSYNLVNMVISVGISEFLYSGIW